MSAVGFVNSRSFQFICMATTPKADTIGETVDESAKIALNGKRYASVAHSANLDGHAVSDIYILTPAEPTCAKPAGARSASGVAFDPASYSPAAGRPGVLDGYGPKVAAGMTTTPSGRV
jgi:hypothetical protein